MIQLERVSKHFNNIKAVDDISFTVKEGETVVLLGTSGCGKTTTLRMINRLAEPTSGQVFVNGQNIQHQPAEKMRRSIGYVLQHHGLFPHYTVAENIAIVPNLLKWSKEKINKRTEQLLDKLQLPQNTASVYPSQLSGGQQQRVGLARALAAFPPVLLMDEPLGALDPVTRADIRKEFSTLDELKKTTILMVTHDVQEAFELGNRICLMNKGKIVQIGKAADLLFHPADDFVRSFLREQRLQLELQSLNIKDIWPFLPKAINGTDEEVLLAENNLWQVLERISLNKKSGFKRFVSAFNNDKKQIDIASVMTAYSQYKNPAKHG